MESMKSDFLKKENQFNDEINQLKQELSEKENERQQVFCLFLLSCCLLTFFLSSFLLVIFFNESNNFFLKIGAVFIA
jgi:hypothetical protein